MQIFILILLNHWLFFSPSCGAALPEKSQGYIQVFLDGGLNQQRMGVSTCIYCKMLCSMVEVYFLKIHRYFLFSVTDVYTFVSNFPKICDAVAVAKILNATLIIPYLEVNPVWQDSRYILISSSVHYCIILFISFEGESCNLV